MSGNIVILTGAGISAESGIPTFRAADGLWEGHRVEDVATPEAYERQPEVVQKFYNERRRYLLNGIEANEGHRALARLEAEYPSEVLLVTQNIDNLHEKGGSQKVLHMHGELLKGRCLACGEECEVVGDLGPDSQCSLCEERGKIRPAIVWFGEMPDHMPQIEKALMEADLFLSVGTSGQVYPAAGFVEIARVAGAETIEVNLDETIGSSRFARTVRGKAGETLPGLVEELLNRP